MFFYSTLISESLHLMLGNSSISSACCHVNVSSQHYLFSRTQKSCLKFKVHELQTQIYIPEINKIRGQGRPSDNLVVNLTPHMPIPKYNTTIFKEEIMILVSVNESAQLH